MSWFTDLLNWNRKEETPTESTEPQREAMPESIDMEALSETARREVERLTRQALRSDATMQDINRVNEMIDAVVEQDRREKEYSGPRDWSEPGKRGADKPRERDLSGMSLQELQALERQIEAQREWTEREEALVKQRRWGTDAGTEFGTARPSEQKQKKEAQHPSEADRERREGGRRSA